MADTYYFIYRADGTLDGGGYKSPEGLARSQARHPTWSFETTRRPVVPVYVPPVITYEVEREYPGTTEALAGTHKVMHGFYAHEGNDPTKHTAYRDKEVDFTPGDVPAMTDMTIYAPGDIVSTDNGFWICANGTNTGLAATANVQLRPPVSGRVPGVFWKPFDLWDGEKLSMLMGSIQSRLNSDSISIDPANFQVSMTCSWTNGQRYGLAVYAGSNKPSTVFGTTTGVTEGMLLLLNTSNANSTVVCVYAADGTTTKIGGTNEWVPKNGATSLSNKQLSIPRHCNLDTDDGNKIEVKIICWQGTVRVIFDGVDYGTYTYDADKYPFRYHQDPDNAERHIPVNHRNINFGLIGFGDDIGIPQFDIYSLEVGKVDETILRTRS